MRRLRFLAALVAALALISSAALAATSPFTKIKGGTTTVTLTSAAATALSSAHLTVTPIAPATSSGTTFTFPISGGRVNLKNLHGVVRHKGGLTISNGTKSGVVRQLTILANGKTAGLYGLVRTGVTTRCHAITRHHRTPRCRTIVHYRGAKLANITGVTQSGASATGQATLTKAAAQLLDKLAGGTPFKAGDAIGTVTVTPTF